jgi:hypothetical protein
MLDFSRRRFLQASGCGFGYVAFSALAAEAAKKAGAGNPLAPKTPHFAPRAKHMIFLTMQGGPSHVDTFDYKPSLKKYAGKSPGDVAKGLNGQKNRKLMPSPFKFAPRGKSGIMISELYPHLSKHADDLCLLNSMHTDVPAHPQALVHLHTGSFQFVRPSVGAWVLYGLGSENQDLPGFITIRPPARLGGAQNYGSAFLPAMYQGTKVDGVGKSMSNLKNAKLSRDAQRRQIDLLQAMNRDLAGRYASDQSSTDSQIDGVIQSYELAFRMQSAVPKVLNMSDESQSTLDMYGVGNKATQNFGQQCLMARRCIEAGVRYVECTHTGWDQHKSLRAKLTSNCQATDQPIAALLADLKQRDLLKETLIVWSGEFGRTPAVKNDDGRDHNATGFTTWMAGGGVKGGIRHGASDEFGIAAAVDKVHIHDLHATMLHLLGLDHERLTYRYAGRDFRLTNVYGNVVKKIIA